MKSTAWILWAVTCCISLFATAHAATLIPLKEKSSLSARERFGPYEDNYVVYQWMKNNGWIHGTEGDLRAHYSMGFSFKRTERYGVLFTYTGEFDFYVFSRDSGPVINRISNPALHYLVIPTWIMDASGQSPLLNFGLEHESDGQVGAVDGPSQAQRAQENYDAHNRDYFDQISRGANFISAAMQIKQGEAWDLPINLRTTLRSYFNQDYNVTWGPLANQQARLSKYNLLRTRVGWPNKLGNLEIQWTVGDGGFKDQSFDLSWEAKGSSNDHDLSIPIYIRFHHGPLNTLSNYTQRQDSLGIGLRFKSN